MAWFGLPLRYVLSRGMAWYVVSFEVLVWHGCGVAWCAVHWHCCAVACCAVVWHGVGYRAVAGPGVAWCAVCGVPWRGLMVFVAWLAVPWRAKERCVVA